MQPVMSTRPALALLVLGSISVLFGSLLKSTTFKQDHRGRREDDVTKQLAAESQKTTAHYWFGASPTKE